MKSFKEIRSAIKEAPKVVSVFNKKVNGIPARIEKCNGVNCDKGKVMASVDGDVLDVFKNEKEAMSAIKLITKELKK